VFERSAKVQHCVHDRILEREKCGQDPHRELLHQRRMTGLHFWARDYCVSTVGYAKAAVRQYIREQEQRDKEQSEFDFDTVVRNIQIYRVLYHLSRGFVPFRISLKIVVSDIASFFGKIYWLSNQAIASSGSLKNLVTTPCSVTFRASR
jgi:hypothetical protein